MDGQQNTAGPPPHLSEYVFAEKLGSGTYANVYKAYKKNGELRDVVAVKCISKSSLNRASVENLLVEIEILKQIKHEHVVQLHDFQWDSHYIYLIMEYCGGGDLSTFIQQRRMLPVHTVKRFLQQLAAALQVLRENNVSHFDLKPQNILLTSYQQPVLKIADFGFAQFLEDSTGQLTCRGSPLYMAPEIATTNHYDAKADLWSVGVILYEALFGRPPFASRTMDRLIEKIKSNDPIEIPTTPQIPDDCHDLLVGLLQRDPSVRMSFEDFFNNTFVDLEHKPSDQCLPKATEIIMKAIESDQANNIQEASSLYSEAIAYFLPAIYYERDEVKKRALRTKVNEYCRRAEHLKVLCRPSSELRSTASQKHLLDITSDHPQMLAGLKMVYIGYQWESQEQYQKALEYYEQGFSQLIPILQENLSPTRKNLLKSQIQEYLKRAEGIKSYLSSEANKTGSAAGEAPSSSSTVDYVEDSYSGYLSNSISAASAKCIIQ